MATWSRSTRAAQTLAKASRLTAAQFVMIKEIAELGETTLAALLTYADTKAATVEPRCAG